MIKTTYAVYIADSLIDGERLTKHDAAQIYIWCISKIIGSRGAEMITIKKLMLVSVLLATAANTYATTRLSSPFNVPEGASVLVILFLLPSVGGGTHLRDAKA